MTDEIRGQNPPPWSSTQDKHASTPPAHQQGGEGLANGKQPTVQRSLQHEMDSEVEKVLRGWDENVKHRHQRAFHLSSSSPRSATSQQNVPGPRARRRVFNTSSSLDSPRTRMEFPEIDIIKRQDASFDTSTESLDDDSRGHSYTECPETGQRMFHMEIDVAGYDPRNVSFKVSGSRLIVQAQQTQNIDGRKSTTEFCRKVKLPSDVDSPKLKCTFRKEVLIVQAPTLNHPKGGSHPNTPTPSTKRSPRPEPLNTPVFRQSSKGKVLHLLVEVGRIFQADDVLVKVKSHDKLVVKAQRDEQTADNKMTASLSREFALAESIVPQSLKAGLTADGVLKITAHVKEETRDKVVTNGTGTGPEPVANSSMSGTDQEETLTDNSIKVSRK